jgi:Na+-exporting ATPase
VESDENKLTFRRIWVPASLSSKDGSTQFSPDINTGQFYTVETSSDAFLPTGQVTADATAESSSEGTVCDIHNVPEPLHQLTLCAALCSSASVQKVKTEKGEEAGWEGHGDATEVALQVYAHKLGYGKPHLTTSVSDQHPDMVYTDSPDRYELVVEHAFDSSVKRMSMVYICTPANKEEKGYLLVVTKGAFERVFERCTGILALNGRDVSANDTDDVNKQYESLASQGLRVLTMCSKRLPLTDLEHVKTMNRDDLETNMSFLGLAGIYDPPRTESAIAVGDCHRASIVPRMLTGDHIGTAIAIAQSVGILRADYPKSAVMTGPQFDQLSDAEVDKLDPLPSVVARCAPETKVRMVEALHRRGRLCIMTGDGVNDAPSLKRADVGVAMGLNGSDVAKQCAEIVLTDDNFATIIVAVRKGRGIFFNLAKFMLYLMSGNIAQIVLMLIGLAFIDDNGQSTFPISPVAILWVNTLCAGPPALALGLEETPSDAMDRAPSEYQSMFTMWWIIDLFAYGFFMAAIAIGNFAVVMWGYFDGDLGVDCNVDLDDSVCNKTGRARGAVFATFLFILLVHAFNCKHPTQSIFRMNLVENKPLLWSVTILLISVFPVIYIPVINDKVFLLFPIAWEWGMVFASMVVFLGFTELYKLSRRRFAPLKTVDMNSASPDAALAEEKRIAGNEKIAA